MEALLNRFTNYLRKECRVKKEDNVLLALSGGLDSIVLAHLLHQIQQSFAVAHCNFQLRGSESDEDEAFVILVAKELEIPCFVKKFDTAAYVDQNKVSVQMAARTLRYDWFKELKSTEGFDCIATAHHANDVAETVLLNLSRSTGIQGLKGILPCQNSLVRPLLCFTKEELLRFARERDLKYREDASNAEDKYTRNHIRLNILPLLEKINPAIINTLSESASNIASGLEIYTQLMEAKRKDLLKAEEGSFFLKYEDIAMLEPKAGWLFELLRPFNLYSTQVNDALDLLESFPGRQLHTATHRIASERQGLRISPLEAEIGLEEIVIPKGASRFEYAGKIFHLKYLERSELQSYGDGKSIAVFDADKLSFPIAVRKWQQGDSFIPYGMKSSKKVSDFFISEKLEQQQKNVTPLIISGGKIAWIAGYRISSDFAIDQTTKRVVCLEYLSKPI